MPLELSKRDSGPFQSGRVNGAQASSTFGGRWAEVSLVSTQRTRESLLGYLFYRMVNISGLNELKPLGYGRLRA